VGDYVRRVVIDASIDNALTMYVERIGDERLLQVATSLDGIDIKWAPDTEPEHVPSEGISQERADALLDHLRAAAAKAEPAGGA
jgi:hypothetical protein